MLIPILSSAWQKSIKPWLVSPQGFIAAFAIILVSVILMAYVAGSFSKLISGLGWTMLIPGILALIFAAFGQTNVYNWASDHITGFTTAEPVVNWLIEDMVPKVAYLGGIYILVGMCLIWIGRRMQNVSQFF